ncbi:MAG: TraR/DksA C4-type zinc finger protein [Deltaproteobacteria bacterium]|nr:TraR/DksA C4-type zinc finger protein [Deltaproteobacteria bacterium]
MSEKDLTHLKNLLLRQRREILDRLQGLESDWQTLSEHDIEREEEAQKADLASLFDQLEERERLELEDIELALTKMGNATYGICEKCHKALALERLEVLPATRFCRKCEAAMEEKQKKPAFLP